MRPSRVSVHIDVSRSRRSSPGARGPTWSCRLPPPCLIRRHRPTSRERDAMARALEYMALAPGTPMQGVADRSRVHRLVHQRASRRSARRGADCARPSRQRSRACDGRAGIGAREARPPNAKGLDRIFREAGFEWREPGCSMCLGMNPDILQPGERSASTSNRNFEGRQGRGGRTHLVSPAMAAAAAVRGHFTDVRQLGVPLMQPLRTAPGPRRAAVATRHRHRSDHPEAVSEEHRAHGLRPISVSTTGA